MNQRNRPIKTYLSRPMTYGRQVQYDYTNQAWLIDGVYVRCGHPAKMVCECFGRLHAGEKVREGAVIH